MKCSISSGRSNNRSGGMTLIEVVAATAILGTLLAGLIVARAKLARQDRSSRHRAKAAPVADRLLESWWHSADGIPRQAQGVAEGYRWTTSEQQEDEQAAALGGRIVRLELRHELDASDRREPDLAVELLVPLPEETSKPTGRPPESQPEPPA